jgi:hypothetical protein
MPNTKAVGVAYADPQLDSVVVTGAAVVNGGLVSNTVVSTGDAAASNLVAGVYFYLTAIQANVTTTTAPKGSIGTTSNATGAGKMFISDGSKWQFAAIT